MQARVRAVVNRVLPWRNEMPTLVPLLSHKGRTRWLRIAFTGVVRSLVRRAIYPPAAIAAARHVRGVGKRRSGEGRSCRRLVVRLPRGGVCLRTSARVARERDAWTRGRLTSPNFPAVARLRVPHARRGARTMPSTPTTSGARSAMAAISTRLGYRSATRPAGRLSKS